MLHIRKLLDTRLRYLLVLLASALFLALVVIVIVNWQRVTGLSLRLAPLDDRQQEWLTQKGTLRIGGRWEEPPFAFFDEAGTYQGYEVDLARSLGPVLGIGIEVVPMPQEEALIAMENGEIDAIMGMVRDPQTSEKYSFTEPYVSSSVSIFVRSERFDVTSLGDLQGHRVAVQADTAAETALGEQAGISSIGVQSAEEGLELLVDEQVSALVADEIAGLRAVQLMSLEEEIKAVGLPTVAVNYSFAVPKADDTAMGVLRSTAPGLARLWSGVRA
jgi:ABC-type amino acid transport substrate-binding protein